MRIAYVRVSTAEQNEARQVEALREYDIERWYTEKSAAGPHTARSSRRCWILPVREI